jgi:putative tricarboxylic transport membrane protein
MFVAGLLSILSFQTLALIFGGVVLGIIFGAIPGITVTMGVALFLPITFGMTPIDGLSLLMGLYIGGTSGGLISAILLKIPGTPASIATTFDGHPMAVRGEAGRALGIGIVFSFIGGMFSLIVLMLLAPALADFAIQFGSYEYFSIALFSLTMISSLSGGSLVRGFISAILGMMFAFVGMAPITAYPRFTFGISALDAGFSLLPALIGLFAVSQILETAEEKKSGVLPKIADFKIKGFGFSLKEFKEQAWNCLRSSIIGTGIGILPGLGGAICNIVAYGTAQKQSKHPEKFGTGIIDGIVASETSNNASTGGALVPLMTLGIPGDNTTAIILAGFMIHGITPGPLLFSTDGLLVYGIFAALIVANLFMLVTEFAGMRIFVRVLSVPKHILLPIVAAMCVIGSYGLNNRVFDVWTMLLFGAIGYFLKKLSLPSTPLLLGFILGPIMEINLRRGLQKSHGSFAPFVTEPISAVILVITLLVVVATVAGEIRKVRRKRIPI